MTLMPPAEEGKTSLPTIRQANDLQRRTADLGSAKLQFDHQSHPQQEPCWRLQKLRKQKSPRLLPTNGTLLTSREISELVGKSDDEVLETLLDDRLSASTFIEYLQQHHGTPQRLLPWLHTLTALVVKVGLLLESTRFLSCDLTLAKVLMHMQTSARALCGARRALGFIVSHQEATVTRVNDKGEVVAESRESLATGTSFAAHCARAGEPLLVGPPGTPQRNVLHLNVDSGSGCRPETSLCVPCLDHAGRVLAVIQVIDRIGNWSFGREQVLLLQRFSVQCGISLRDAGCGVPAVAASGEAAHPGTLRHRRQLHQGRPEASHRELASIKGRMPPKPAPAPPRKPPTATIGIQCDLILAPLLNTGQLPRSDSLTQLLSAQPTPRGPSPRADTAVEGTPRPAEVGGGAPATDGHLTVRLPQPETTANGDDEPESAHDNGEQLDLPAASSEQQVEPAPLAENHALPEISTMKTPPGNMEFSGEHAADSGLSEDTVRVDTNLVEPSLE
eukprot:CAMPEP_0113250502 /NCGR_PEP_ID=MMETSP0008_2-20120614/11614_1 /TAXON_ID=97485 /ORGANISM="Prymnesium parvum" /LENGTH=503 /DNA_ID=CAMNT_0000098481 /DNA_START=31 /DNA_END=1541 /DNA_ORIENTATION=+ /assembly_acc=CAM_ASM_000153